MLHSDLQKGGEMILTMGPEPSGSWGENPDDRAYSLAK